MKLNTIYQTHTSIYNFTLMKYYFALIFAVMLFSNNIFSQISPTDIQFLKKKTIHHTNIEERNVSFGLSESENIFVKYNPASLFFGALMYGYQKIISPQFSAGCLFNPSCSDFSKQLVKEYGLFKGVFTTADRLMRCNRLSTHNLSSLKINKHDHKIHESTDIYKP